MNTFFLKPLLFYYSCKDIEKLYLVNFVLKISTVKERQINILILCLAEIFCVLRDIKGGKKHHLAVVRVI